VNRRPVDPRIDGDDVEEVVAAPVRYPSTVVRTLSGAVLPDLQIAPLEMFPGRPLSLSKSDPFPKGDPEKEPRMGIDQALVGEIVRRILSVSRPERIVLFGSAATGKMTRDSDIDLLVLEGSPSNPREEGLKIRAALRGMGHPFDVIVMATERFEESKGVIGGIAYPANKYGRVI
jgi:predicted nucleotidyltransferase